MKDIRGAKKYLKEMNELCKEQTGGYEMTLYDIEEHLESQEFIEKFGRIQILDLVIEVVE